jgi:putative ABC transport system permease protein
MAWLVAIANIAGLVLVHTQRRTRELAIRTALGASRAQVIAIVAQEMVALAAAGGGAGLVLASMLVGLVPQVFTTLPRLNELALDWRSALFAVLSSLAAALVCAIWPAAQATRRRTTFAHVEGTRSSTATAHWSQRVLVGAQVALGVVLCTSAALLSSSYYTLTAQNLGLDSEGVVTFRVGARWDEDRARVGQMQEALFERIAATPGVSAIGMTNFLPEPVGTLRYQVAVAGLGNRTEHGAMTVGMRMVSAGYHDALRVPLLAGTGCPRFHMDFTQPRVALVNRQFVDRYGQGQHLTGRQLTIEGVGGAGGAFTIAGVIGDVAEDGAQTQAFPFVYTCPSAGAWPDPHYVVRTADPDGFTAGLRELVRGIDSTRAVFAVRPLSAMLRASIAEPRLNAGVVTAFAGCALLLAALGLYTLFARLVTESRREIGVRLALGATPSDVLRLVVSHAGGLLGMGVAAGIVLSLGAYQLLRSSLHQTPAFDLAALGAAVVTLTSVSAVAILLPAIRASRVPPTEALRGDG